MTSRTKLFLALAAALAAAAYAKRPVRPPVTTGSWQPADQERATR